ncbi:MAG: hypothetical protein AAFU79_30295, partial [Myxococcota bacterium]
MAGSSPSLVLGRDASAETEPGRDEPGKADGSIVLGVRRRADELRRHWQAMRDDLVGRNVAAAFAMAMAAYMVDPMAVLPWALVYGLAEALMMVTLRRASERGDRRSYLAQLGANFIDCAAYDVPGILLWLEPTLHEKICGFIYLFGGVISVSAVRASHLPFGLASYLAHLCVLSLLPVLYLVETGALEATVLLGASVLATMGYFLVGLVN